jgi:hypothetical protein
VNECEPCASDVDDRLALPDDTATGEPRGEPLSENWTVPTAVDGATVAVMVTVAPTPADVVGETPRLVVVACGPDAMTV